MELIRGLHNLPSEWRPDYRGCVATIGAFDGVHRGHQRVISQLLERARELALPSVVILFEPLPREFLTPEDAPARLMSFREKFAALAELGVDRLLCIRFSQALRSMSAQTFIHRILVAGLGVRHIMLGDDFRFGNDRQGDTAFIHQQGQLHGYTCAAMPTVEYDGERISSTRIRKALAAADFGLAQVLLGRPYSIGGKVVYGRQLGRTLGAPTANVDLHRLRSPLAGVYAVRVDAAQLSAAPGVASIGTRPTIAEGMQANLEVHLIDRCCVLYGQRIKVTFLHKLREELKFDSIAEMGDQIGRDIANARDWLASDA
ncbi:MAG: bifunctional riboflavin kinase/FAD synthetase [Parahaliea sp.]